MRPENVSLDDISRGLLGVAEAEDSVREAKYRLEDTHEWDLYQEAREQRKQAKADLQTLLHGIPQPA